MKDAYRLASYCFDEHLNYRLFLHHKHRTSKSHVRMGKRVYETLAFWKILHTY